MSSKPNVVWQSGDVTQAQRQAVLQQKPLTIWFTGLPGAGKSTLAFALEKALIDAGHAAYILDGDNVRHGLCRDLGFSPADRSENIRRIAEVAKLMNDAGLIVIAAFVSPINADREMARDLIGSDRFVEIHVSTPLAICEARDPKGMYKKARQGLIAEYTGVSAPYESPMAPSLSMDTSQCTVHEAAQEIHLYIKPMVSCH